MNVAQWQPFQENLLDDGWEQHTESLLYARNLGILDAKCTKSSIQNRIMNADTAAAALEMVTALWIVG